MPPEDPAWIAREAARTLARLRLPEAVKGEAGEGFEDRLEAHFPQLFGRLHALYGHHYDFFWHLERIVETAAEAWIARKPELRAHDAARLADPDWLADHRRIGAVAYVDRFAGDLKGLETKLPHLESLGVTYLHLMPLFRTPEGENDGGYAVSSYREVDPRLGSMAELEALAGRLRAKGISLVLDFVLNHTADDHPWAEAAKAGDPEHQAFYWMFDDRTLPDRYAQNLREIFPERGGDAFVWRPDVAGPNGGKHVWSTFYPFQWDLNYANPAVFRAMAEEMLFLANRGVEVLRLDAVPFLWKAMGTACENLPEAHWVVQALNAMARIAAPALTFKSEAIVHPDDVARYVDPTECQLSYNPLFMVLLWEALATRDTALMRHGLETRFRTAPGTAWINYIRGHDDIGWGFANEDAALLGIDPGGHRRFLNDFYTGRFPGSFARGLPFQENPRTGDCRISGTLASLAGLEHALALRDETEIDLAIRRILVMHGLIMTLGGIPLLYLGDEIAQLNDYGFELDEALARDNRWVHRPAYDWARLDHAEADPSSPEGRVLAGIRHLVQLRQNEPALSGSDSQPVRLDDHHLIAFHRIAFHRGAHGRRATIVANMSEHRVEVPAPTLQTWLHAERLEERVEGRIWSTESDWSIAPYAFMLLVPDAPA